MNLLLFTVAGFAGMEVVSYLVHRFLFHGLLWNIHQSHHEKGHDTFELNDLFSLAFATVSIYLMISGSQMWLSSWQFGTGLGIALYGVLYFIVHDLYAHRRFFPISSSNWLMQLVKRAHQNHHQSISKKGQEPYGLFLFPYKEYEDRIR